MNANEQSGADLPPLYWRALVANVHFDNGQPALGTVGYFASEGEAWAALLDSPARWVAIDVQPYRGPLSPEQMHEFFQSLSRSPGVAEQDHSPREGTG